MTGYDATVARLASESPALAAEVAGIRTLEHVVRWMRDRGLSLTALDVVTQDEFTHDVLVPLGPDGRHVVFGAT
jgi:hypothetical protein